MSDFKLLSSDQLIKMCREFMIKKPQDNTDPDPDHEGWTAELRLTPRMVSDILDANQEI
jgi:hypothetical protein